MKTKFCLAIFTLLSILLTGCSQTPPHKHGKKIINLYGFSIMKEPLEKAIYPAFIEKWKREHGEEIEFTSQFAGSETITNQILQGASADIAILSIERDVERLATGGAVTQNWKANPHGSVINKTAFIIIVRKENPLKIRDFSDLAGPGIKIIHPNPVSSGGAQWSILAIYGSELKKSEWRGSMNPAQSLQTLQAVWKNVISTPGSAREARTQFETGIGDALITYEIEGLMMKKENSPIEIVVPPSTIFSEHPAVVIDRNVSADKRNVVEAFLRFLWSDEAQKAFVGHHFRSVTNETFNNTNEEFAKIEMPFTVDLFGGWTRAYPEIIENVFIDQVNKK